MENIKYSGGLLPEPPRKKEDHLLGSLGDISPIITQDPLRFWLKYPPRNSYQTDKNYVDLMACVAFSINDGYERFFNYLMDVDSDVRTILDHLGCINEDGQCQFSDSFTAMISDTDPNNGNSTTKVCDSIHTNGLLGYKFLEWDNTTMTKAQFYDKSKLTPEILAQAKKILEYFDLRHMWVGGATTEPNELKDALTKGLVRVSVDGGNYRVNQNGYIYQMNGYNHSVLAVGGLEPQYNVIHDHYRNQYPKFVWGYKFGNGKLLYVIKKKASMICTQPKIRVGRTILFLAKSGPYSGNYIGYYSSEVYKAINGEFNKADWTQDPLGQGIMPQNIARDGDGNILCIGMFGVGSTGTNLIEGEKIEDINF